MPFDWENTNDLVWLQEAARIEAEAGCDIQVGGKASSSPTSRIAHSQLQSQLKQVRLQSLLFRELRILLAASDLGVGMEAAFTAGRQLIRVKLQHLSLEQQNYFEALIAEDAAASADKLLRAELGQMLCSLLDRSEWEQIAQAAMRSLQTHLLEQVALR